MEKNRKENLYTLCSYLEAYATKVTPSIASSFVQAAEELVEKSGKDFEEVLPPLQADIDRRLVAFLQGREPEIKTEREVGFAYCVKCQKENEILQDSVAEVKKKGLLKRSLSLLDMQEDLPLSVDQKIKLLLSCLPGMPKKHKEVAASLLIDGFDRKTKQKVQQKLPVRVVVSEGRIVDIFLAEQQEKTR